MEYLISAVMGYLFGTFNLAHLMAKSRGFDIRNYGSNNPGASNAVLTMGWKAGVLVGLCDIFKATIPSVLALLLFSNKEVSLLAGAFAVVGHMYPVFLKFRGGKGFASFLGMILGYDWKVFLIIGVSILLIVFITNYIVMGTFLTISSFPVYLFVMHAGYATFLVLGISMIIFYKHQENIRRIRNKQELKIRSLFMR